MGLRAGLRHDGTKPLIDAIMRQTTVLIAALSMAAGIRTPFSHIADQTFLS